MLKKLMSMRLVAAGAILLVMATSVVLPGCAIVLSHYNGHWVETMDKDGNIISKKCEPGGSQCTVAGIDVKKNVF